VRHELERDSQAAGRGAILEGPHWTEPVEVVTVKARGGRIEVQVVELLTRRLRNKLFTPGPLLAISTGH
jgi:hypothetical protein